MHRILNDRVKDSRRVTLALMKVLLHPEKRFGLRGEWVV